MVRMLGLRSVFCRCCCSLLFGALTASAGVLVDGERVDYQLYIEKGFMSISAGTAQLTTTRTNDFYDLVLDLSARPAVEAVYHFKTTLASRVTPELQPFRYVKHAEEGSRIYDEITRFSYPSNGGCRVESTRTFADGRVRTNQVFRTEGVYDLVSVIFQARTNRWKSGAEKGNWTFPVATGLKVEEQVLIDKGLEDVETSDGEVVKAHAYSLLRRSKTDTPPQDELARFWLADDARHLPVRINLFLKFGTVSARAVPVASASSF